MIKKPSFFCLMEFLLMLVGIFDVLYVFLAKGWHYMRHDILICTVLFCCSYVNLTIYYYYFFCFQISSLAQRYPGLMSLRSVDLSPASWMAVAWYVFFLSLSEGIKQRSKVRFDFMILITFIHYKLST